MKKIKYFLIGVSGLSTFNIALANSNFAYVPIMNTQINSDSLSILDQNPTTGQLYSSNLPLLNFSNFTNLTNVATDPSGRFLYALTMYNGIYTYTVDSLNNGALNQFGAPITTNNQIPLKIVFDGNYAYIPSSTNTSASLSAYLFNSSTGALTLLQTISTQFPTNIVIDSSGKYAFETTASNQLLTYGINLANGSLSLLNTTTLNAKPTAIAADKNGHIYLITYNTFNNNQIIIPYSVDATNGNINALPSIIVSNSLNDIPRGITISPNNTYAYVPVATNGTPSYINIYNIDPTTGVLSSYGSTSLLKNSSSAELSPAVFDPTGQYMYVTSIDLQTIYAFSFNSSTGQLTPLPSYNINSPLGAVTFN